MSYLSRFLPLLPSLVETDLLLRSRLDLQATLRTPMMIISNTADPITPLSSGHEINDLMGNSSRLLIQNSPGEFDDASKRRMNRVLTFLSFPLSRRSLLLGCSYHLTLPRTPQLESLLTLPLLSPEHVHLHSQSHSSLPPRRRSPRGRNPLRDQRRLLPLPSRSSSTPRRGEGHELRGEGVVGSWETERGCLDEAVDGLVVQKTYCPLLLLSYMFWYLDIISFQLLSPFLFHEREREKNLTRPGTEHMFFPSGSSSRSYRARGFDFPLSLSPLLPSSPTTSPDLPSLSLHTSPFLQTIKNERECASIYRWVRGRNGCDGEFGSFPRSRPPPLSFLLLSLFALAHHFFRWFQCITYPLVIASTRDAVADKQKTVAKVEGEVEKKVSGSSVEVESSEGRDGRGGSRVPKFPVFPVKAALESGMRFWQQQASKGLWTKLKKAGSCLARADLLPPSSFLSSSWLSFKTKKSPYDSTIVKIYTEEGLGGLYAGLSSSVSPYPYLAFGEVELGREEPVPPSAHSRKIKLTFLSLAFGLAAFRYRSHQRCLLCVALPLL